LEELVETLRDRVTVAGSLFRDGGDHPACTGILKPACARQLEINIASIRYFALSRRGSLRRLQLGAMGRDELVIRAEAPGADKKAIYAVNEAAFGRPHEATLVDALRVEGAVLASLVADVAVTELERRVVGHILFSRMWIDTAGCSIPASALAPMAVLPEYQGQGIGGRLIQRGLDELRRQGEAIVIVLGHPAYYPRFGFSTAKTRLLQSPFPPEAYMAMELRPGALNGIRGRVRYTAAFGL
jgi:putative acetyltransferase